MATPKQAVHEASKSAARDLAKGLTGRIIQVQRNLISVAVYDSITSTSMDDYDTSVKDLQDPVVESYGSIGMGASIPILYKESTSDSAINRMGRVSNVWAPPSTPRIIHVSPGIAKSYSGNIDVGDWVSLIPMGTGDTYSIGTVLSHATDKIYNMNFATTGQVETEASSTDAESAKS